MKNDMNDMKKKAYFYFEKKITIHIETKDKQFYNGLILEISDTFFVIHDRVVGEVFLSFSEISDLDKYRNKNEVKKWKKLTSKS